ncbi:MAG TPA: hypothetical protein VMY76_00910 [Gemmatimonadales bacterium]|nr:hypothetical protein [Gemmatimonadales bacterium]
MRLGLVVLALASCRNYDYAGKVTDQDGLTPPDQFARYGTEQAEAVAIAREFGRAAHGESFEALAKQAETAVAYAKTLPDVADVDADPLGHRLTVRFKSGWRVGVAPVDDGKGGAETPGVKPAAGSAKP